MAYLLPVLAILAAVIAVVGRSLEKDHLRRIEAENEQMKARIVELEALSLCENCGGEETEWKNPRYCWKCWGAVLDAARNR